MLTPREIETLRDLIDAKFEGTLNAEEAARLDQWVCRDEDACRFYVDYNSLHGMLLLENAEHDFSCAAAEGGGAPAPATPKPESPVLGFLGDCAHRGASILFKSNVFSLLVAIGLPSVILLILMLSVMRQPAGVTAVARLTRLHDCQWDAGGAPPSVGAELMPGEQLRLRQGLAEITFADGATVLLEGPSTFEADGRATGYLHVGRLVAEVTGGARKFIVRTPSATVIDLGTEFGLTVAESGQAEAHVFQGEVEVVARPEAEDASALTKRLVAGEAVKVTPGKVPRLEEMAAAEGGFARHVPGTLAKPTILFAHRGSNDPTTEGWQLVTRKHDADIKLGPVEQNGIAAWSLQKDGQMAYTENSKKTACYTIQEAHGLDPKLVAEAKQKGWVMRARVWISDRSARVGDKRQGLFTLHYHDDEKEWGLHPTLERNGDQLLLLLQPDSSLEPSIADGAIPISGSRNRYVDYEVRYHPATKSADVYINGRRVATGFARSRGTTTPALRFGFTSWTVAADVRVALFEWGILRDAPQKKGGDGQVGGSGP